MLRSLNVFLEHAGHDKCPLPQKEIKSSLCTFCLTRSLAIRANSFKGRNKINPVEVFGENLEYFQSVDEKKGIQDYLENVFESDVLDTCFWFKEFNDKKFQGKDISVLMNQHERKEHKEATVLFVACEYGISVDLNMIMQFDSRRWKCKSVISKSQSVFYYNKTYYSVEDEENLVFNETVINHRKPVIFLVRKEFLLNIFL